MNRNLQKRELRLIIGKRHIVQIEKFVELICDDYHVYDEYYANIIAANTMLAEYICNISNNENHRVDVKFFSDKSGMRFLYYLGELFLDIASNYERINKLPIGETELNENNFHSLMAISLLCDEIVTDSENSTIELFFRITGVNELLTLQRIELLKKYFSMVGTEVKQ